MASELEMTELEDAIDRHRARIADLEAENERLKVETKRALDGWSKSQDREINALDRLERAEAAEAAERLAGARVVVKPLEWEKGVVDWAKPLPGMKYVACSTTPSGSWAFWLDDAPETRAVFGSEEAAKAAAQADYERRILSALAEPAGELHGPYAWLSGDRSMSEDSWTLSDDPQEISAEYFSIPLYAKVDPFKEKLAEPAVDPKRWREHIGNIDGLFPTTPPASAIREALEAALETMKRYKRAGHGDDVFMSDLCQSIRKAEAALAGSAE